MFCSDSSMDHCVTPPGLKWRCPGSLGRDHPASSTIWAFKLPE